MVCSKLSNVVPTYPNGLFQWTDRVDQVNIDFANDINSVASDLISVENTLGINPQIEKNPPNPTPTVTYSSADARISDAMSNAQLPVCILRAGSFNVNNTAVGVLTPFTAVYDPFGMFNGTDITIVENGWHLFTCHQTWSWWNDGYAHTYLQTNGSTVDEDLIDWEFSGNGNAEDTQDLPRWQRPSGQRSRINHITWQGRCSPGERISLLAENGSSNSSIQVSYTAMHVSMIRTLPAGLDPSIQ